MASGNKLSCTQSLILKETKNQRTAALRTNSPQALSESLFENNVV